MNASTANQSHLNDALRDTLTRVQELSTRMASSKHQQIRVTHWVRKLLAQPTINTTWTKNVLEYANALLQMLLHGALDAPFTKMPPQGPLPTLPRHAVVHTKSKPSVKSSNTIRRRPSGFQLDHHYAKSDNQIELTPPKRVQSRQVQTSDGDEQWEWQRVWKGAFEKIRSDLEGRTKQSRALELEVKELRTVLQGYEKALEREVQARAELQAHHQAEVDNLRAVHSLELQELKKQHRTKIQEVMVQNGRELQRRKRDEQVSEHPAKAAALHSEPGWELTHLLQGGGDAFNTQSDAYGDFLAYIDTFHMDTLALTKRLSSDGLDSQ